MLSVWADCRHAIRLYRRTPRSSLIVTLVLSAAIAACAAVLSLYVELVRPHTGFERAEDIATIAQTDGFNDFGIPYAALDRLTREMKSIVAAASVNFWSTLIGPEREPALTGLVSEGFFGGLRPHLALGEGFRLEDHSPDAVPVVVLSYHYWQQQFGGRSDVLGTTINIARNPLDQYAGLGPFPVEPEVDTAEFRIVGVLADSAAEVVGREPVVWLPLQRAWPLFVAVPEVLQRSSQDTYVRMADGASVAGVVNELSARLMGEDAIFELRPGMKLVAMEGIVDEVTLGRDAKRQLSLFLGAGVLLLLVAAANIGLFFLARAPGRRRELGIRMAVGATVSRLTRQFVSEAGFMVVVAAVPGLLGSIWLSLYLGNLPVLRETDWEHATLLDWQVLGLIGAFLLAVTLVVSLAPLLTLRRLRIADMSRHASARASVAQCLAGTVQIAAAGTMGAAAIAFAWYLGSTMFGDPGFELNNRYVVSRAGDTAGIRDRTQILVELDRRREAMESIPGVMAVAFGDPVPGEEIGRRTPRALQLDSDTKVDISWGTVNRDFIDLLGLNLIRGRVPEAGEVDAIVINQSLARAIWGREDVVGERLPTAQGEEIIGVVEDVSYYHPVAPVPPFAFRSLGSNLWAVIETDLTPAQLTQELDRLVAEGALEIRDTRVRSLREMLYESIAPDRARGILTIAAAALVVALSALGFYGTQRYLVAAGQREYAIRASLGAGPRALGRLVHWRGIVLAFPGIVLAAISAAIVVEMLRDGLVSQAVSSGIVALVVVTGLLLFTLAANFGPAHAARRIQPAIVLREDY